MEKETKIAIIILLLIFALGAYLLYWGISNISDESLSIMPKASTFLGALILGGMGYGGYKLVTDED